MNATSIPGRAGATAPLAGAPPAARRKFVARSTGSASSTATKSVSTSPRQTTVGQPAPLGSFTLVFGAHDAALLRRVTLRPPRQRTGRLAHHQLTVQHHAFRGLRTGPFQALDENLGRPSTKLVRRLGNGRQV